MKVGLCDLHAVCVSIYVSLLINFWMAEPVFVKLGVYIMTPEPISAAYFINPISLCVYMCIPLLLLRNDSVKSPPTVARQRR
jgi:hypothetical protein